MKTFTPKPTEIMRQWHLIDASGQVLGRLATRVSRLLMGKNKPMFTRNLDTGDFVIVTNISRIHVTGKKETDKMYYRHSGYPGGFKEESYREVVARNPTRAFEKAVKGMLPHNRLGAAMFRKLKVYAGPEHPHAAQLAAPPAPKKALPKKRVAPAPEIAAKPEAATISQAAAESEVTKPKAMPKPRVRAKPAAAVEKPAKKPRKEKAPE